MNVGPQPFALHPSPSYARVFVLLVLCLVCTIGHSIVPFTPPSLPLHSPFTPPSVESDLQSPPRLVVSIVVDQLRSDCLNAYSKNFTDGGFNRLMGQGTVYGSVSYPFTPVDRASATAAIATGVSPYYNGIVGQRWLNRETLRPVWCVADECHAGLQTTSTMSAETLCTSTLGDELKVATSGNAKVWAVAMSSDAAILSAGHAADGALWPNEEEKSTQRGWCSTQYYMKELPQWVRTVGSPVKAKPNKGEQQTGSNMNTAITDMALRCVTSEAMGMDEVTDLLCLTYSAECDEEGVEKSEEKYQQQNLYVRLDAEMTRLMETIERRVGREHVLFMVTGTGYNEDREVADYEKYRIPTGTFYMSRTADLLNMYLGAIWGAGKYVETTFRNHIFMDHALLDKKKISISNATNRAQELLVMMSGVRNVYTSLQLLTINNEQIQRVRHGYNPERCGDLVIETAPGWRVLTENTGESEYLRSAFLQFPVIFYGAGIEAQRSPESITTDRIAPTLARLMNIRAPNACTAEPLF